MTSSQPPPPVPGSADDDPESHLWQLLASLHGMRTTLLLRAADGSVKGTSLLLGVDPQQRMFFLDATANNSQGVVLADGKMRIESRVEGRRLEFSCRIREVARLRDGPAYVADNPELLIDEQRRIAYRLRLPDDHPIKAALRSEDAPDTAAARVVDISRSGLGATLPRAVPYSEGTTIRCRLSMPDFQLDSAAIVRYRSIKDTMTRLGLQFADLTPAQEAALSRAVFQLERLALRSKRRNKPTG